MRTTQKGTPERGGACSGSKKSGCEFLDGEGMLPLYRAQTERMLRRYFRLSLDIGRLPSILGGEVFRGVVSSSRAHTFEDFVIFVHDMERCMEKLDPASLETIAALVFLDQSQEEAGKSLGLSRRQVERRYSSALDRLSYRLLMAKLMQPLPLALEQPDCAVCLRNPGFLARTEGSEAEGIGSGRVVRMRLELPPKKPAASVREAVLETGQKAVARAAVVGMESYMWQKQIH
jgi:hypothetical protein